MGCSRKHTGNSSYEILHILKNFKLSGGPQQGIDFILQDLALIAEPPVAPIVQGLSGADDQTGSLLVEPGKGFA